ncbi:MAG: hypothetical protein CMA12_00410 [Euryarchaeota archaeon]|nr:hypothetical protein [Euryarchaeota archaeon]
MNFTKLKDYINEKYSEIRNKNYIENYNPYKINHKKKAILYYKCTTKFHKAKICTTEYQSLAIAKKLNQLGYLVTVVDRKAKFEVKQKYELFIGAFNTGGFKNFKHILKQLKKNTKIIGLSTGANPKTMEKEFQKRKKMFFQRNKIHLKHVTRYSEINFERLKKKINFLIFFGYKKGFVEKSYITFKNKFNIQSCISDNIKFNKKKIHSSLLKNFLYYSGTGFLHKGLDLIIEFFIKHPEFNLYICSANHEKKILKYYDLKKYKNIFYEGNIVEDSDEAIKIFNKCGFLVSMNCSGGSSAALAVGRRYGLIPVVLKNEDCNPKSCFFVKNENFSEIKKIILKVSKMDLHKYKKLSKENQEISRENTSKSYSKKLDQIFRNIN